MSCRGQADLLHALKGGVVVAEGTQGVGLAIWPRQRAQQQLKAVQGARQALVQLDCSALHRIQEPGPAFYSHILVVHGNHPPVNR